MQDDPVATMEALLLRTRTALSGAGRRDAAPTTGTSEEGLVSAVVGPEGLVRSISVDPRMLRRTAGDIAAAIASAVNQAMDALPETAPSSNLIDELKAIQEESAVQMRSMSSELTSAVERLKPRSA